MRSLTADKSTEDDRGFASSSSNLELAGQARDMVIDKTARAMASTGAALPSLPSQSYIGLYRQTEVLPATRIALTPGVAS